MLKLFDHFLEMEDAAFLTNNYNVYIFLCRLTRKPILTFFLYLIDCLHEDSHKLARLSERREYWPAEQDITDLKTMYVHFVCVLV